VRRQGSKAGPLRSSARRSKTVLSGADRRRVRLHASRLNRRLGDRRSAGSTIVCRARTSRIFPCNRRVACCNRAGLGVRLDAIVRGSLANAPLTPDMKRAEQMLTARIEDKRFRFLGRNDIERLMFSPLLAPAENRLDASAYQCVGAAARNRQNQLRPSSLFWPVITRQAVNNAHAGHLFEGRFSRHEKSTSWRSARCLLNQG
jgi:hypothetical protein